MFNDSMICVPQLCMSTFLRIAFGTTFRRRPIKNDSTFIRLFTSGRVTGFGAPALPCHATRRQRRVSAYLDSPWLALRVPSPSLR